MFIRILLGFWILFGTYFAHATRDAETEYAFRQMALPFVIVMNLQNRNIQYRLILSSEFNAMVMGGDNVFFNSGLILDLDSAEQFMAVIAHELAHIKSEDLQKLGKSQKQAENMAKIGIIGGIIGGLAAKDSDATIAGVGLSSQLAQRTFTRNIRIQEQGADAIAFQAFEDLKMSLRGHIQVQSKLLQKTGYVTKQQSYSMTHPSSQERLKYAQRWNEKSPFANAPANPKMELLFQRIQAKLFGFVKESKVVLAKYPLSDSSDNARYARAMNAFANNKPADGITEMQALIKKYPNDIFYLDSYATLLYADTQYKKASQIYQKILKIDRKTAMFYLEYARSLIQMGDKNALNDAEWALYRARNLEKLEPYVYKNMIDLYRAKKDTGKLFLAQAEYAYLLQHPSAITYATQAQKNLPNPSPEYTRADDIIQALQHTKTSDTEYN